MKHRLRYQQVMSFLCAAALCDGIVLSTTPAAYASPLTTPTTSHTTTTTVHTNTVTHPIASSVSLMKPTVQQTVILGSDYAPTSSLYTMGKHHLFTVQISTPLPNARYMSRHDMNLRIRE